MSGPAEVRQGRLAEPVDPSRDHVLGPDDAPVTLLEYGDLRCPHCAEAWPVVREVLEEAGGRVRFVFRHFPIEHSHPRAGLAARAAEAAGEQGEFWSMHERILDHDRELDREALEVMAGELELDVERFGRALEADETAARVDEDFESGVRSGVNGTPTFFVGGVRHDGGRDRRALLSALRAATEGAGEEPPAGPGPGEGRRRGESPSADPAGPSRGDGALSGAGRSPDEAVRAAGPGGPRGAGDPRGPAGGMRTVVDRSRSGAPAAGRAVRDIFSTDEIFQRVVATADEEFRRSNRLLFLSGLAAGLTIALSFLGTAALTAAVPGENARAVGNLLYPVGFLLVLLGRYQLFTENTLTPVTLVLTRIASVPALLRVWGVVLAANVLGTAVAAYGFAHTGIFGPETAAVAAGFGEHVLAVPWWDLFWKGVIAGWLVASIVWLNHAARDTVSRVVIVFAIIYLLVAADLAHCVVGACEVLYLVFQGQAGVGAFAWDFFTPVTLGNTVGGVLLVAILNFSQTRNERITDRDCSALELPWRDWCLSLQTGRPDERR